MKTIFWMAASVVLGLIGSRVNADSFDFRPAAQLDITMNFWGHQVTSLPLSINLSLGYDKTFTHQIETDETGAEFAPFHHPRISVLPLLDLQLSTVPGTNDLRIVGFSAISKPSSSSAATENSTYFGRNWGWFAAGGVVAIVAGVAAAGHGGSDHTNTANANQCQITVIGGSPTNTSSC